ncbi:MAG: hypothetical protein ACLRWQ_06830 [Flavonifractor plautii]
MAVLKRCGRDRRFSREGPPGGALRELCRELEEKGIPYSEPGFRAGYGPALPLPGGRGGLFHTAAGTIRRSPTPEASAKPPSAARTTRNFRGISR